MAALLPTAERVTYTARTALMDLAERADQFRFLIRDHGPQFTAGFDAVFHAADIRIVTTGIQAPVMNAIQERRHRTVRTEPLDRTLVWNLAHLRRVIAEYESFYTEHRPHRALGQVAPRRPLPKTIIDLDTLRTARRDRIDGEVPITIKGINQTPSDILESMIKRTQAAENGQ